jgi:hypothetical protein
MALSSSIILSSCAGTENYQTKMNRYSPKLNSSVNLVPEFASNGFQFKTKATRMPASTEKKTQINAENALSTDTSLSNKKLYFMSLLGQFETLKKFSQEFDSPSINICPHFHGSVLELKDRRQTGAMSSITHRDSKVFTYDVNKFKDPEYIAKWPELSLPMSSTETNPKVIDRFMSIGAKISDVEMNEIIHKAIDIHLEKTYFEVRELCETGVSSNYYIYENLITHIKNQDFKPFDKNMNTLLKTTIFSNMAIVTSLEKLKAMPMRSIASENIVKTNKDTNKETKSPYSKEVMNRLNVEWAEEYFDYLKTSK